MILASQFLSFNLHNNLLMISIFFNFIKYFVWLNGFLIWILQKPYRKAILALKKLYLVIIKCFSDCKLRCFIENKNRTEEVLELVVKMYHVLLVVL